MTAEMRKLSWRGDETIAAVSAALAGDSDVQLYLPAGFHHAVCSRLDASARTAAGSVNVAGGAELLSRLAGIRGLEPLARLEAPALAARAEVRIVSPSPTIMLVRGHDRAAAPERQ